MLARNVKTNALHPSPHSALCLLKQGSVDMGPAQASRKFYTGRQRIQHLTAWLSELPSETQCPLGCPVTRSHAAMRSTRELGREFGGAASATRTGMPHMLRFAPGLRSTPPVSPHCCQLCLSASSGECANWLGNAQYQCLDEHMCRAVSTPVTTSTRSNALRHRIRSAGAERTRFHISGCVAGHVTSKNDMIALLGRPV